VFRKSVAYIVVAVVICFSSLSLANDKPIQRTVRSYDIIADGEDVGDLTVTRRRGQNQTDLIILSNTKVMLSGFMWSWNMSLDSRYEFSEGVIKSFDHKLVEDGKTSRVSGGRLGDFIQTKNGKNGFVTIDTASFDATLEGVVNYVMNSSSVALGTEIQMLDTVELTIRPYTVMGLDQQAMTIGGIEYACRLVKMKTPEGYSTYLLAEDDLGAFLVKESGADEDGPYEIRMKESREHSQ